MNTLNETVEAALSHAQQNAAHYLEKLQEILRIPSISTRPEHDPDLEKSAEWFATTMRDSGLENVRVIPTCKHPLVYGDWLHAADAPTVLFYGHYDVQPVEPLDLWESPPFDPDIRESYIYARGASDDKGQTLILINAVEAFLQSSGTLPVNVKFIIEGDEESGGEGLAEFVPENGDLLAADVAYIADTHMPAIGQPSIIYGLRGIVALNIDIVGPNRDLHSGSYGGAVDNPINALTHILSALKDADGNVNIPGFYDRVRPITPEERARLANSPVNEPVLLAHTGIPAVWGEADFTIPERVGARPTLDINGIIGGYTGEGVKTIIPSKAHAKITMRLVPDQDPQAIAAAFTTFVQSLAPATMQVTVIDHHGGSASISDYNHPGVQAAADSAEKTFHNKPIFMREGGSIPIAAQLQRDLGVETILLGFGLPGDNLHAPNERFYLPNFYAGIETVIRFMGNYGTR